MRQTTCAYRQGDAPSIKTIVLLSAPGRNEENAGQPASGETGRTLEIAIELLNEKDPHTFPSSVLNDYTIANAVETIHYKNKTGRTEATDDEVRELANIDRLRDILEGCLTVAALGRKAYLGIKAANYEGSILAANHPSLQSLNSKYKSDKGSPLERRKDRISQWTDDLINSNQSFRIAKE